MAAEIGHNGGPLLGEEPGAAWRLWNWKRASQRAWKTPPREIARRRLARAEDLGMSYRAYALEILERGRHLWGREREATSAKPQARSHKREAASAKPQARSHPGRGRLHPPKAC